MHFPGGTAMTLQQYFTGTVHASATWLGVTQIVQINTDICTSTCACMPDTIKWMCFFCIVPQHLYSHEYCHLSQRFHRRCSPYPCATLPPAFSSVPPASSARLGLPPPLSLPLALSPLLLEILLLALRPYDKGREQAVLSKTPIKDSFYHVLC